MTGSLRPDAAGGGDPRRPQAALGRVGPADDQRPYHRAQRDTGGLFLEGQGWGFGGSVDIAAIDPWNVPGRYGWVGGTGTAHTSRPPARSPSCSPSWLRTAPAAR